MQFLAEPELTFVVCAWRLQLALFSMLMSRPNGPALFNVTIQHNKDQSSSVSVRSTDSVSSDSDSDRIVTGQWQCSDRTGDSGQDSGSGS